ncbi:Spt20 family-domain-containing protein [Aspergillus cavernicola]|uniref:Spt20 family-domain-containing protein n=1 Tax=Aspergillus cavernicola TaxID=176166 RepID=A0ABR4IB28_9EURO
MATAISKTTSHPSKMKRPPPPFIQSGVNSVRSQQSSSSPPTTSKRLPGAGLSAAASSTSHPVMNGVNGIGNSSNIPLKGSLGRSRKDAQRQGDQSMKLQRPIPKTSSLENDRRSAKAFPEPYVKTTPYLLKKFSKFPPSLILHLHPTHFRFEQQDGSFPYNSEMKVIIEHIRAGTVPHDMMEELLRANVRFYEGCLIVRVVDHKSISAQTRKSTAPSSNDNNTPFSIHNYNEHITPSAYVPYPKQNQLTSEKVASKETTTDQSEAQDGGEHVSQSQDSSEEVGSTSQHKQHPTKPRVFTTVLHPTPRSLQAELTLLATTPDPKAARQAVPAPLSRPQIPSSAPLSPGASSTQPERGNIVKRQKMLVEPEELLNCEASLTRALAPPLFLDPVGSLEGVHDLLKYMESPVHCDAPPSPKRRKRTIAELAADEALAAEEERFMLIMDERLEPTTSGAAGGPKSAVVGDTGGAVPFEPRFSRFKTLENIRMQHEEKAKREHEIKMKQDLAKRQQQEQDKERRRIADQRQAEEQAKEETRRQQLAQQQAQAHLAAQQQQNRPVMAQTNGVSQAPQSSPVVRNQTPLNTSSPLVSSAMAVQNGVPMAMTSSMQGAGSPPRPPSALQHAHPNMMSHPMVPSRSQQSRHGTPQMTQGTPAMSHATPIMRNVTPTQRMSHASPPRSSMAPTPVMGPAMMATPQMGGGMSLTPQQQQQFLMQRQQLLAQQGHLNHSQLTPQQYAQLQANMHAQQNIQNHQQQVMQQQQQNPQPQQKKFPNSQAYQAQLMRAQLAQMQMAQRQQQPQPQPQGQQQPQPQQGQMLQNSPQMNPQQQQQQQMLLAAAQANGGQLPQNMQGMNMQSRMTPAQRYSHVYQQRLLTLRQDMTTRLMPQYGPPTQYPPQIAQEYSVGLEQAAKGYVQDIMRREREAAAAQQRQAQVAAHHAQVVQQQQHNMMQNGMGK